MAGLSRFISRSAEKGVLFFKVLRKGSKFEWTKEAADAFDELKKYTAEIPLLTKPMPGEDLVLYISVGEVVVSSVLIREEMGVQKPIYYVSRMLRGAELKYIELDKGGFAFICTARKLRPYFLSHKVKVRTNLALKQVLGNPNVSGRLVKWAVELSEYDAVYEPRVAIKAQVLADFLQEMAGPAEAVEEVKTWTLYTDGSTMTSGAGMGIVLTSPGGENLEFAIKLGFKASNNETEYEAVLQGVKMASDLGERKVCAYIDSQLVACQFSGSFEAKEEWMAAYLSRLCEDTARFNEFKLEHLPRTENIRADQLARIAGALGTCDTRTITLMELESSLERGKEVMEVEIKDYWRTPIWEVLVKAREGAERITTRDARVAARFCVIHEELYKRSRFGPFLKCLAVERGAEVLREIHEGYCGDHVKGKALVNITLRAGFFWPGMKNMAVSWCESWEIDIVGPFPRTPSNKEHLVVAVIYFTKWVEAEAVTGISEQHIMDFIFDNIFCRYGAPRVLVSDNGTRFNGKKIQKWCKDMGIKQRFASAAHSQTNGQVEVTNRIIVQGLKLRLEKAGGLWEEELTSVLWAYRTTPRNTTGESPFSLVYGMDALVQKQHYRTEHPGASRRGFKILFCIRLSRTIFEITVLDRRFSRTPDSNPPSSSTARRRRRRVFKMTTPKVSSYSPTHMADFVNLPPHSRLNLPPKLTSNYNPTVSKSITPTGDAPLPAISIEGESNPNIPGINSSPKLPNSKKSQNSVHDPLFANSGEILVGAAPTKLKLTTTSQGFGDFLLKPELLRAIVDSGPLERFLGLSMPGNGEVHNTPKKMGRRGRKKRKHSELTNHTPSNGKSSLHVSTRKKGQRSSNPTSVVKSSENTSIGYSDLTSNGSTSMHGLKIKTMRMIIKKLVVIHYITLQFLRTWISICLSAVKEDQRMHKLVFENGGLPNGSEVAYYSNGKMVGSLCFVMAVQGPFTKEDDIDVVRRRWAEYFLEIGIFKKPIWNVQLSDRFFANYRSGKLNIPERFCTSDAVTPAEIVGSSQRLVAFNIEENERLARAAVEAIDEIRERAAARAERYKQRVQVAFNKRVKHRYFQVGDLVWKRADALHMVKKLEPNWIGPFKIRKLLRGGVYILENAAGQVLPRSWNVCHLKKYYA
ncbi:pol polyprotein [Phtheirospermum japonicum]|uniref:Pol polyprotein n=1 Tax=Phtheirospermum japonicum TaxID=374723 RepID=A0A830BEX8_9LAMI|nr:pol polyprotein [Phtheirospermum japonicum]